MGKKIKNTFYSDREIRSVLLRHDYVFLVEDNKMVWVWNEDKREHIATSMYDIFSHMVNKRNNQTKEEFLDSL